MNRYEFYDQDPLGAGAFGKVFKAKDLDNNRDVVIKVVTKDPKRYGQARDVNREHYLPLVSQTSGCHRNVGCLYDYNETDKSYMFVSEFISSGEFDVTNRPTEFFGKLDAAYQLADGLEHLHKNGIAHRDIKPANIMLRKNGSPVIIDLGLSCIIANTNDDSCKDVREFVCGGVGGSPRYMSPEMLLGKAGDVRKSDVYSLGIVFYLLFNGGFPYKKVFPKGALDNNKRMVMARIKLDPRKSSAIGQMKPTELNPTIFNALNPLDNLINRMLEKMEDRPTMQDVKQTLGEIITDLIPCVDGKGLTEIRDNVYIDQKQAYKLFDDSKDKELYYTELLQPYGLAPELIKITVCGKDGKLKTMQVTEKLDGTLTDYIRTKPSKHELHIEMEKVIKVIQKLNSLGHLHEDVHTENIMYKKESGEYKWYLIDFELAKEIGDDNSYHDLLTFVTAVKGFGVDLQLQNPNFAKYKQDYQDNIKTSTNKEWLEELENMPIDYTIQINI